MQDLRFTLRRAAAADVETLRRLAEEAFPATYREILSAEQIDYMMEWMYAREKILGEMAASTAWFVAEADGEPCGYLSVERAGDEVCILRKIYLLPRFQGCGGGEFLFRRAVACARPLRGPLPHGAPRQPPQPRPRLLRADGHALPAQRRLPHRRGLSHERLDHGSGDRLRVPGRVLPCRYEAGPS